jgi:AAA domain
VAKKGGDWVNNDGIRFYTREEMEGYDNKKEIEAKRILRETKGKIIDFSKDRKAKAATQKFIIDKILPEGEFHVMSGTSGVGKSTLLLPVLSAIQNGEPVWGFQTVATPLVYLMCDSSSTSLERKLQRLGLHDWKVPAYALEDLRKEPFDLIPSTVEIWDLPNLFPWAKLFVIEAYGWFYTEQASSGSGDYTDKMRFWSRVRDKFNSKNLTILGTTHTAKFTKDKGYENVRDKPLGSVAQPAAASTVMSLEDNGGLGRVLKISPRDYKPLTLSFGVDGNGVLQFLGNAEEDEKQEKVKERTSMRMFDSKLSSYQDGEIIKAAIIKGWYMSMNISKAAAYRWLEARLEDGTLERVELGIYKIHRASEQ